MPGDLSNKSRLRKENATLGITNVGLRLIDPNDLSGTRAP